MPIRYNFNSNYTGTTNYTWRGIEGPSLTGARREIVIKVPKATISETNNHKWPRGLPPFSGAEIYIYIPESKKKDCIQHSARGKSGADSD